MSKENPIKIEKSEINKLQFTRKDPLRNPRKRKSRLQLLKATASVNPNEKNGKLKIHFKTNKRGVFSVNSKVLVAQPEYVILKGGTVIPTNAICKVEPI